MAGTTPWAVPQPRRARDLLPAGVPRRRELIAVGAVAILVAHLLLAQFTLVLAVAFAVVSKTSRWRLWWLLGPTAAGLGWTIAAGPSQAIAGFTAGPSAILWHLAGGHLAGRQPLEGFGGAQHWLPRQFPIALIAGAAEAALIGWLDWLHTDEWAVPPPRPGLIATARRAVVMRAVRSGAVVTREGCALGVVTGTGAVAEMSWAEAVHGTLVVGAAERDVTLAGLQVVHAALRRRKPVIVLDFGGDVAWAVRAACLATGVPLRAASPSAAMGAAGAAGYATRGGFTPRLASGKARPAGASGLWGRNSDADNQADGPAPADLGRVLREREAALLTAESPEQGSHTCAELTSLAGDLRRIGVDGDALVWVPRGERVPAAALDELLGQAPEAGLAVLIGTTSPAAATELSALVGTVLIHRVADQALAASLAARTGTRLLPRSLAGSGYPAGCGYPGAAAPVGFAPAAGRPVGVAPAGTAPAGAAVPSAGLADTGTAMPDLNLVPSPVVGAGTLLTLGQSEFVLAVSRPRHRIIAPGLMVPARLPRAAEHAAEHQAGHHPQTGRRTRRQTAGREAGT
jgi:hypothetical protein